MMTEPNIYGKDLLGRSRAPKLRGVLSKRFGLPPFTVLNAREGTWQARKRAWVGLGIQSEIGRGGNLLELSDSCEEYRQREGDYSGPPVEPGGHAGQNTAYRPVGQGGLTAPKERKHTASLKGGLTFGLTMTPYAEQHRKPVKAHKRVQGPSQPGLVHHLTCQAYRKRGQEVSAADCGTSIFDPVLCELMYRWFCPPGGTVLDPFAGGSVRGIVAGMLGRRYWGCDLSEAQVKANRQQARDILDAKPGADGCVEVRISAASARLKFNGCDPDYIRDVCHASCCRSASAPGGALVTVHPSEELKILNRGEQVKEHMIVPRDGRCPFQGKKDNLCKLHGTGDKPFGCVASPFTLNRNGTLIVRNRYKSLKCYDDGRRQPAYVAFRASLDLLFGADESARICRHLDAAGGDVTARMPVTNYRILVDNDAAKRGEGGPVQWVCGDSADELPGAPEADMIFSCPPYGDLEQYSRDPRDLSNMKHEDFRACYWDIIAKAAERLKPDRFAAFVVGDFRGPDGAYRDFPADTTRAFRRAGLALYNQAVLITAVGSLSIRVARQFEKSRKLGMTHQQVLVYVKGDPRRATELIEGKE
jgi:Fe-S-cluster containining protein